MDFSDAVLKQLDFVIGSVHSRFKAPKEEMTKRIIKAIENKYVNAIGHPTGRLINARNPYEVDLEKIFQKARENNVLMEINASPERLDLKDIHVKQAKEIGVKFVISTEGVISICNKMKLFHKFNFTSEKRRTTLEKSSLIIWLASLFILSGLVLLAQVFKITSTWFVIVGIISFFIFLASLVIWLILKLVKCLAKCL